MQQLKAAFHVIDRYRKRSANLTNRIYTDHYDRQLKSVSLQSSFHIIVIIGSDRLVQIAETSLPRLFSEITLTEREKTARNTAILTIVMFEYIMHVFTKLLLILEQ